MRGLARRRVWLVAGALAALAATALIVAVLSGGNEANGGTATRSARWVALQPSPLERSEIGAARIGRFIYVVGGFVAPDLATTDQVARYDVATGSWSLVAPLPIGVNHPAVAAGGGRCRGDLYVYGGYTANGSLSGETDALQRFDPDTGIWTVLPGSGVPRGAAALTAVGCSLYAVGGASAGTARRTVQTYDIRSDRWRRAPSLRVAREHLASVAIRGRILAFGGRDSGGNLDTVEELDSRGGKWRRRPPVPTPRSGFGAAPVRGWAVVVGGEELSEGGETIRAVEAFDPRTRRWRKLPGMLTPRHGLGVASRGLRVFAIEGGPRPGGSFSATLEVLWIPRRLLGGP
jgi:N-acetylneuraminic acid mutarotase